MFRHRFYRNKETGREICTGQGMFGRNESGLPRARAGWKPAPADAALCRRISLSSFKVVAVLRNRQLVSHQQRDSSPPWKDRNDIGDGWVLSRKDASAPPVILAKARIQIGGISQTSSMRKFLDSSLRWNDGRREAAMPDADSLVLSFWSFGGRMESRRLSDHLKLRRGCR